MSYQNLPTSFYELFRTLNDRLEKLERSNRFGAPNLATAPAYPRNGDIYYDTTTATMKYYNGSAWVEMADNTNGTSLITTYPTLSATGLTYTGNPATTIYQKIGKTTLGTTQILCTNITNFGTGQWTIVLPAGTPPARTDQTGLGSIELANGDHYPIWVTVESAGLTLSLWYLITTGSTAKLTPLTGTAPVALATTSKVYISGLTFLQ